MEQLSNSELLKPLLSEVLKNATTITVGTKAEQLIGRYNIPIDSFEPNPLIVKLPTQRKIDQNSKIDTMADYKVSFVFGNQENWNPFEMSPTNNNRFKHFENDLAVLTTSDKPELLRISFFLDKNNQTDTFGRAIEFGINIKSSPNSINQLKQFLEKNPESANSIIPTIFPKLFQEDRPHLIPNGKRVVIL